MTSYERIARIPRRTRAYGIMIYDLASRAYAARSGTGISTFLTATRFVLGTLGTDNAFGSTRRRTADVPLHARAHGLSVDLSTLTVGTARRRVAWVRNGGSCTYIVNKGEIVDYNPLRAYYIIN